MVSAAPNQLTIYDPISKRDTAVVPLPLPPSSVSVGPDGRYAAVGHDAVISYVNLATARIEKSLQVSCDVLDVVLAGNGWVYAFPRRDQWTSIRSVQISTGTEATGSAGRQIYAGTVCKLHPNGRAIYGANNGLSPSDIEKYNIASGSLQYLYDSPYHGDYPMCGDLWISEDGLRIFTRCGAVFRSSDVQAQDMTYNGKLSQISLVGHLSHSVPQKRIVVVPGVFPFSREQPENEVQFYNYEFLSFAGRLRLPDFEVEGQSFVGRGKFVFVNNGGTRVFVVMQADPTSGLLNDFGVLTFSLDAPVVSAASLNLGALAANQIVTLFGSALAETAAAATTSPLPTSLGGRTVKVMDSSGTERAAPLFYVGPGQVNLLIPPETALGSATISMNRPDGGRLTSPVEIVAAAPGVFSANSDGRGVAAAFAVRVRGADQTIQLVFQRSSGQDNFVPNPIDLSVANEQVYLVLFGTGIRGFRQRVTATVGGASVAVQAAVPHPEWVGLDQVNLGPLPSSLRLRGEVPIVLFVDGKQSNPVTVALR